MMHKSLFLLLLVFFVFFSGCSEDVAKPTQQVQKKEKVEGTVSRASDAADTTGVIKEDAAPVYHYDPAGRRDPFEVLLELRKQIVVSNEPLTPLQQVDLGQFRLTGVIVGKGAPMAMVSAPGGKSYILKKGVKIGRNNGVVIGVDPEGVSVQEKYYDFEGAVRENVQKIELPKREGAY